MIDLKTYRDDRLKDRGCSESTDVAKWNANSCGGIGMSLSNSVKGQIKTEAPSPCFSFMYLEAFHKDTKH